MSLGSWTTQTFVGSRRAFRVQFLHNRFHVGKGDLVVVVGQKYTYFTRVFSVEFVAIIKKPFGCRAEYSDKIAQS